METETKQAVEFMAFPKMGRLSRSIIPLTNGGYALCSEEDFDNLKIYNWFHVFDGNQTYAARRGTGDEPSLVRMHTFIFGCRAPDHINGDGLDNRRENLRQASASQNQMNRRKFAKAHSRFKGVTWNKKDKRWIARIKANGMRIHLGNFFSELDAAMAYNKAAIKYFGEFSNINEL